MGSPDLNYLSAAIFTALGPAKATHAATFEQVCDYVWSRYRAANDPQTVSVPDVSGIGETIYQELIASGVTTATGGVSYWLNQLWNEVQFPVQSATSVNIQSRCDFSDFYSEETAWDRIGCNCRTLLSFRIPFAQTIAEYCGINLCDRLEHVDIGTLSASVQVQGTWANALEFYQNRRLQFLYIYNVVRTGGLHIAFNTALTSVDVSRLATVDYVGDTSVSLWLGGSVFLYGPSIAIEGNRLTGLSFPALTQAGATHTMNLAVRSEPSMTSISAPLVPALQTVLFENLAACASIDLSGCATTGDFDVRVCPLLVGVDPLNISNVTSISGTLTLLASFFGATLNLNDNLVISGLLKVINTGLLAVNGMKRCNGITITNNASLIAVPSAHVEVIGLVETTTSEIVNNAHLTHITFAALTDIKSSMTIADNPIMSYLRAPLLQYAAGLFYIHDNALLNEITLPSLARINVEWLGNHTLAGAGLTIQNCPALATLDLSGLVSVTGDIRINACTSLTTVDLSSFVPTNGQTMNFVYNVFSAATINAILARCVANAAFVSGTLDFRVAAHQPSGQGLIDKATLIARGVNVYTI